MNDKVTNIRHPRHTRALAAFHPERVPANQRYIVIVYDGGDVPDHDRKASFTSDAPAGDVKLILEHIASTIVE